MKRQNYTHQQKVRKVSDSIKGFRERKEKFRIYHGSTNSTRSMNFKQNQIIDISLLNQILSIDTDNRTIDVEPNVPMDKLLAFTTKHGLMPAVVPELPGITVGGAIQGAAAESTSFRYGAFHENSLAYELVLGNGKILSASPEDNADIFWGSACSYGSLAILTKIKLKLIPAKPFVELSYYPVKNYKTLLSAIKRAASKNNDFVEGLMFSNKLGVVISGVFTDKPKKIKRFSRAIDELFYLDAQKIANKGKIRYQATPLKDYLFRYDRGAFWMGSFAAKQIHLPTNRLTRFIFNPLSKTRKLFRALQLENFSQQYIIQDFCLPIETSERMYNYISDNLGIYPLWILPSKISEHNDFLSPTNLTSKSSVINIGAYGEFKGDYKSFVQQNRNLERQLMMLGGKKVLYAHSYYTEKEFWKIYDKNWYQNLRKKYSATTVFPTIYNKTKVTHQYETSLLRGAIKYLLPPYKLKINV